MTILVSDAEQHILHSLGGGRLSPELSSMDILNEAGEFLIAMHPWKFRERGAVALDFVADTSYVVLPADFAEVTGYSSTSGLTTGLYFSTVQDIVDRRTTGFSYDGAYVVAVTHYLDSTGVPIPRLEIWPTPTASSTGDLTIFYRAGWVRLAIDAAVIPLPTFARSLYYAIVRAFAQGYEQDSIAGIDERLAIIQGPMGRPSPRYRAAMERDAHVQPNYGELMNGAVERMQTYRNLDYNEIPGPS